MRVVTIKADTVEAPFYCIKPGRRPGKPCAGPTRASRLAIMVFSGPGNGTAVGFFNDGIDMNDRRHV
jgi:hypothetical protein